jgi:hypothetical protein
MFTFTRPSTIQQATYDNRHSITNIRCSNHFHFIMYHTLHAKTYAPHTAPSRQCLTYMINSLCEFVKTEQEKIFYLSYFFSNRISILSLGSGILSRESTNPRITLENNPVTKGLRGISRSFTFKRTVLILFCPVIIILHKVSNLCDIAAIKIGYCIGNRFIRHNCN